MDNKKTNEIEIKIKNLLKNNLIDTVSQYYIWSGETERICFSDSGSITENIEYKKEFDQAITNLIEKKFIYEIESAYKETRMFQMVKFLKEGEKMENRHLELLKILYQNQENENFIKAEYIKEKLKLQGVRNISYLLKKIKAMGYEVESKSGYHGGYRIIDDSLTKKELEELREKLATNINGAWLFKKIETINSKVKLK